MQPNNETTMHTKTASKTALALPSPNGGARLPLGAHPGNTGGKPGRSGRPPNAFKELCAQLASREATLRAVGKILMDPDHPAFIGALKWVSENGYGRPLQRLEVDRDVNLTIRLVRELPDKPAVGANESADGARGTSRTNLLYGKV
jgi:hypothetical protein